MNLSLEKYQHGDMTPVNPVARTLAYLLAVVGQLYVAVLIAGLVASHIASAGSTREPEAH